MQWRRLALGFMAMLAVTFYVAEHVNKSWREAVQTALSAANLNGNRHGAQAIPAITTQADPLFPTAAPHPANQQSLQASLTDSPLRTRQSHLPTDPSVSPHTEASDHALSVGDEENDDLVTFQKKMKDIHRDAKRCLYFIYAHLRVNIGAINLRDAKR